MYPDVLQYHKPDGSSHIFGVDVAGRDGRETLYLQYPGYLYDFEDINDPNVAYVPNSEQSFITPDHPSWAYIAEHYSDIDLADYPDGIDITTLWQDSQMYRFEQVSLQTSADFTALENELTFIPQQTIFPITHNGIAEWAYFLEDGTPYISSESVSLEWVDVVLDNQPVRIPLIVATDLLDNPVAHAVIHELFVNLSADPAGGFMLEQYMTVTPDTPFIIFDPELYREQTGKASFGQSGGTREGHGSIFINFRDSLTNSETVDIRGMIATTSIIAHEILHHLTPEHNSVEEEITAPLLGSAVGLNIYFDPAIEGIQEMGFTQIDSTFLASWDHYPGVDTIFANSNLLEDVFGSEFDIAAYVAQVAAMTESLPLTNRRTLSEENYQVYPESVYSQVPNLMNIENVDQLVMTIREYTFSTIRDQPFNDPISPDYTPTDFDEPSGPARG